MPSCGGSPGCRSRRSWRQSMAYVPVAFILAGMTAYTVLAGADFGAGLWTLLAVGPGGQRIRDEARHAMGPVWEANHVWLIFVLVVGAGRQRSRQPSDLVAEPGLGADRRARRGLLRLPSRVPARPAGHHRARRSRGDHHPRRRLHRGRAWRGVRDGLRWPRRDRGGDRGIGGGCATLDLWMTRLNCGMSRWESERPGTGGNRTRWGSSTCRPTGTGGRRPSGP